MGWLSEAFGSSIGKKFIMALTGIGLILFLIFHLVGNLTLYGGHEAFNGYVETLDIIKPIIRVIEVGLGLVFVFHIFNGIRLWLENRRAKPINNKISAKAENSSFFSRIMVQTGSIVFIFLVLHLATFWWSFNFTGEGHEDPNGYYNIVVEWFQIPWYAIFYAIAVILLGFHLNHGFQSAFQTFGWNHNKYFPFIKKFGTAYAIIMALGFASFPIYFLFFYGGN